MRITNTPQLCSEMYEQNISAKESLDMFKMLVEFFASFVFVILNSCSNILFSIMKVLRFELHFGVLCEISLSGLIFKPCTFSILVRLAHRTKFGDHYV